VACKVTGVTRTMVSAGEREALLIALQTDAGIRGYAGVAVDGYSGTNLGFLRDAESTLVG
jgi:hypothetical protein